MVLTVWWMMRIKKYENALRFNPFLHVPHTVSHVADPPLPHLGFVVGFKFSSMFVPSSMFLRVIDSSSVSVFMYYEALSGLWQC